MIVIASVVLLLCSMNNALLFEGDNCTVLATNASGQCLPLDQCEYAKNLLEKSQNLQPCGFKGRTPLVCCSVRLRFDSLKPGQLSRKMCSKYFDRPQLLIAPGEQADPKDYGHMAAVGYGATITNVSWLCGGTLISHHFVLSAAHCADSPEYGQATWVRLGTLDLQNADDEQIQDVRIAETHVHPLYKFPSHYHDIVLFRLQRKIHFELYIEPACLHVEKNFSLNTLEATGWGRTDYFGEGSNQLMKVNLKVVDHETCAERYTTVVTRRLKEGVLDKYQLCAGHELGKDTCPGDSGGPLHYLTNQTSSLVPHFVIVGITSFGKGCGAENTVGVYTRVSAYIDWIEDIVWKGVYS